MATRRRLRVLVDRCRCICCLDVDEIERSALRAAATMGPPIRDAGNEENDDHLFKEVAHVVKEDAASSRARTARRDKLRRATTC